MSANVIVTDDRGFERAVLKAEAPVLVDFWAPWCGPCRMVAPMVEQLAGEYAGRLRAVKVNVDDSPVVAKRYGIQSIPTLAIFRQGREVRRLIGVRPKAELVRAIEQVLSPVTAAS
ncbi:MAG: thioredoxin [Chloroflexota bacterium]